MKPRLKTNCLDCGGAGCKACILPDTPKVFFPIEPMPYCRTTQRGKKVDERYKVYCQYKEQLQILAMHYLNFIPQGNAIEIEIVFKVPLPKSWSKVKKERNDGKPHISTPDVDNLIKGFFDSLKGVAWHDDCFVFKVTGSKFYSSVPGIEAAISYFPNEIK